MYNLQILNVTISRFRGIPGKVTIPLNSGLTVIYAANGTGKSTLCQAVEWLLTGILPDVSESSLTCKWGDGETFVAADCIINGQQYRLTRTLKGLEKSDGQVITQCNTLSLLSLLSPKEIGAGKNRPQAVLTKQAWLRNSRWLYSNALSLLVDESQAEQRSQVFANILGYGHLIPLQQSINSYLQYLPGVSQLTQRLDRLREELRAVNEAEKVNEPASDAAELISQLAVSLNSGLDKSNHETFLQRAQTDIAEYRRETENYGAICLDVSARWEAFEHASGEEQQLRTRILVHRTAWQDANQKHQHAGEQKLRDDGQVRELDTRLKWMAAQGSLAQDYAQIMQQAGVSANHRFTDTQLLENYFEKGIPSGALQGYHEELSRYLDVARSVYISGQAREEWQSRIRRVSRDEVVALRVKEQQAADELKRMTYSVRALDDQTAELHALGLQLVSQVQGSCCPLCTHDWVKNERLLTALRTARDRLSPEAQALNVQLEQMRSDYAGMEEMLREKEGLLRDADAFSASLAAAESKLSEAFRAHCNSIFFEESGITSSSPEQLSQFIAHLDLSARYAAFRERLLAAEAFLKTDTDAVVELSVYDRCQSVQSSLAKMKDDTDIALKTARLAQQVSEMGLKQTGEDVSNSLQQITAAEAQLVAVLADLQFIQTQWRKVSAADLTKANLLQCEEAHASMQNRLNHLETLYALAQTAVDLHRTISRAGTLRTSIETLERRIDEHTRRKREGEQARDELASEIERLTSLSLKNLIEPASEMFSRMHANEVYDGLKVAKDGKLRWRALTGEKADDELITQDYFSQGQRQDLALSLYLARARTLGGTFFLDEPVAHLDDMNRVAMTDIFRMLTMQEKGLGLVLTTASDPLRRHLRQKFSALSGDRALLSIITMNGNPRQGVSFDIEQY
ncbi:AAA family ATPase [Escherichia coli]|uniref:AAA family ATPase n=1 Tax=Escherichia coli TaxID=562 RepID=UPI001D0CAAAA|nr:AAA family ATPase [Escherichia coli]